MKKINLLKTALLAVAILCSTSIFAQHLFEITYNSVTKADVAKLKTALTKTEIKTALLQKNNENADYYSINLQSNQNTKIIILNETTGKNVEIVPTENAENEFQLVPFLVEELKQSTLGNATRYLIFETNNNNDVKSITSVPVTIETVYIPRYFYGKKEEVKEALPQNRKILRIFKEMPHFNLEDEDNVEMQQRARNLEESLRYYVYAYLLPDGTIAIYDEHFNPKEDKNATKVLGNLSFVLTGSMSETQRASTVCGLDLWSEQMAGTIPVSIDVNWQSLGSGIIGGSYRTQNFLLTETNTWYCSAVWNQIVGYDATSSVDINLVMSTNFSFYMPCQLNTGSQINYVTIVLHEVCHGLGYYALTGQNGNYTYTTAGGGSSSTSFPGIYDRHLYQGTAGVCITELTAAERQALFISNNLYSGGPLIEEAHGSRVRMYAPSSYQPGSSVSHWGNSGYNFSNNTWMKYAYAFPLHTFNTTKIAMMKSLGWTLPITGPSHPVTVTFGANGYITPSGVYQVAEGADQTFTITPNTHYKRATVLVDGVNNATAVSTGSYTFTNVMEPHTLSATFAPNTYTITFNANGGSGTMEEQNFTYGVPNNINENEFTKPGHEFMGWNTQASGTGVDYTDTQLVSLTGNLTLYAKWFINAYSVTSSTNSEFGTITPEGTFQLTFGTTAGYTMETVGENSRLDSVVVNGVNKGAIFYYSFESLAQHSYIKAFFSNTTGITSRNITNLSIYSNNNKIYFQNINGLNIHKIEVMNMLGSVIYESSKLQSPIILSVPDGVYFVKVLVENAVVTKKIVLKK